MGLSHRSRSDAAPTAPLGPAEPCTALPPCPFFMSVMPWAWAETDRPRTPASRQARNGRRDMTIDRILRVAMKIVGTIGTLGPILRWRANDRQVSGLRFSAD